MNKILPTLIGLACLLSPVYGDIEESGLKVLSDLRTKRSLDIKNLAVSPNLATFAKDEVRERHGIWASKRLNDQDRFVVLDKYINGEYAAMVIGSRKKGTPFHVDVHPLCFRKIGEQWLPAPLLSNFTYALLDESPEDKKKVDEVLAWLRKKSTALYLNQLEKQKQKFQEEITRIRKQNKKVIKTARQQVDFFLEQVHSKSLAGVCAAVGYDVDDRWTTGQDGDLILESFLQAFDPNIKNKGGWNTIFGESTFEAIVNVLPSDESNPEAVMVAFFGEKYNDNFQLTSFEVMKSGEEFNMRLPSSLVVNRQSNGFRFYRTGFDNWNLDHRVRQLVDKVPSYLFKSLKTNPSKLVEQHIEKVEQAIDKGNFEDWLMTLEIKQEMDDEAAKNLLDLVLAHWNEVHGSSKGGSYLPLGVKFGNSKDRAVMGRVKLNESNVKRSKVLFDYFAKKKKDGWLLQLKGSIKDEESEHFEKIKQEFGDSRIEMVRIGLESMGGTVIQVDGTKVTISDAAASGNWERQVKNYISIARSASVEQLGKLSCYTGEEKDGVLEQLVELRSFLRRNQDVKVCEVVQGSNDFAVAVVGEPNDAASLYNLYLLVNTKKGIKVDMTNVLELSAQEEESFLYKALLGNKLGKVENVYSPAVFNFLSKNYDKLVDKYLKQ